MITTKPTDAQLRRIARDLNTRVDLAELLVINKSDASYLISMFKKKFYLTRLAVEFAEKGFSEKRLFETLSDEVSINTKEWDNIVIWLKSISKYS